MKNNLFDYVTDSVITSNLTLVSYDNKSRVSFVLNLLNSFSIKDNKKTRLLSLSLNSIYYYLKLLSYLSNIDERLIREYRYPFKEYSKLDKTKIDYEKLFNSIEIIKNSNLLLDSTFCISKLDYLDYILNLSFDILIIDNLTSLLEKTKYSFNEALEKIKTSSIKNNKHIVLLIKNGNNIDDVIKYVDNYIDVTGIVKLEYKDINVKIVNNKEKREIKLKTNKYNQII